MRAFGLDRQSLTKTARTLGLASLAAAAFMMTPSPAQALPFPPSPRDIHNRIVHDVRHALEIPRAIHQAHVNAFHSVVHATSGYAPHPYYHGSYYHGPYYHAAYGPGPRFVVSVGPGPYYYAPVLYPPPPPPAYIGRGCDRPYYYGR